MRRFEAVVISLVIGVGLAAVPTAADAGGTNGPELQTFPAAVIYGGGLHPDAAPAGSNDWSCQPSAAHPRPVVLVHGTWANQFNSWAYIAPRLAAAGYCVFSLNFGKDGSPAGTFPGVYGSGPVMDSAQELGVFIDRVLSETGATKVDLVGYSQGGIVARGYLKFFGGADAASPADNKVKTVVTYAATNHGTTLSGLSTLGTQLHLLGVIGTLAGQAATDQVIGSPYVTSLNAGGDTFPGINYTVLTTRYDEVSTPYRNSFLTAGPGVTVNNIVVQDGCFLDGSDHLSLPFSLRAADYTLKALDPANPRTIRCAVELPAI